MACEIKDPTGNPVCSKSLKDLEHNTIIMDQYINSAEFVVSDRLGVERKTWAGIEKEAQDNIDEFEDLINDKIIAQGGVEIITNWEQASDENVFSADFLRSNFITTSSLGITPGYDIDNTQKIRDADQYCFEKGLALKFDVGVFAISGSIDKKSDWYAESRPTLSPFPQKNDDKINLAPAKKDNLYGTSIVFKEGDYSESVNEFRSDEFNRFTYGIKTTQVSITRRLDNITLILDMDCFNEDGIMTTPSSDNRANLDVGYLIDNSSAGVHYNPCVFGHFKKAGIAIQNRGIPDDPDYNRFFGGSSMGYYGLAIISSDNDQKSIGLSGSEFHGFQLFGNDHISRLPNPLEPWQTNGYGHLLKIDGYTGANNARVNGHNFFGGGWRTYSNRPIILDNASFLNVIGVNMEFSQVTGQPDTTGVNFVGTDNTFNTNFINCRNFQYSYVFNDNYNNVTNVKYDQQQAGISYVGSKGKYVGFQSSGISEPRIIFTKTPGAVLGSMAIGGDYDGLKVYKGSSRKSLINESGIVCESTMPQVINDVVEINSGVIQVAGEVSTFNGGLNNQRLLVRTTGGGLTIKKGGNIAMPNSELILNSIYSTAEFIKVGDYWCLVSTSNNSSV